MLSVVLGRAPAHVVEHAGCTVPAELDMKIAFFLTPKADVAWVKTTSTVRQAIERMEHYRYTAVPLLTPEGKYAGTLTEGDLLNFMKHAPALCFSDTERIPLADVTRRLDVRPIHIDDDIEALLTLALDQNFVPVVDDREIFIGIVRRRAILAYFQEQIRAAVRESREVTPR
ncbi:Inosine-5'-monophosphate dehydrogenase [Minicystis rosea]|nr:Inosine-5'-monophosphate dehydrogenase [Minicystis rosea]